MLARWRGLLSPTLQGSIFYFGFYAGGAAYMPFLSVFYSDRGLSGSEIGLLATVGPLIGLLVGPALTALADRTGRRLLILSLALVGTALGLLALPLAPGFLGLLAVIAVMAAIGSPGGPIGDGVITGMVARYKLSFGKLRLWGSVSWAMIAAGAGALWQQVGFFFMFPLACLLYLLTAFVAQLLTDSQPKRAAQGAPLSRVVSDSRLRVVILAAFAAGVALSMTSTFSSIYLDRLSGGQFLVGLFSGLTALVELPVMHFSDAIMRRLGGPRTLFLALMLFACAYIGLIFITNPILLLSMSLLQGGGFGLFATSTVRLVSRWSPPEWSSTSQGILSAASWSLAPLVAGPIGGTIFDASGATMVFLASAIAAVLGGATLIMAQMFGVFNKPDQQEIEAAPTAFNEVAPDS